MNTDQAIFAAIVTGVHIAALLLLIWALVGDRARGRLRCPKCWYDLSGPTDSVSECPECGRAIRAPRDLTRSRRRTGLAAATIIAQLACGYAWWQRTPGREAWRGLIPNALLIELVDDPKGLGALADTLRAREEANQITSPQRRRLVERALDRWIAEGGPESIIGHRTAWPVGEHMAVWLNTAGTPTFETTVITFSLEGGDVLLPAVVRDVHPRLLHGDRGRRDRVATLMVIREGENSFRVPLRIRAAGFPDRNAGGTPAWTVERMIEREITVIGGGEPSDHVLGVPSEAVEALIRDSLVFEVRGPGDEVGDLWLAATFRHFEVSRWEPAGEFEGQVVFDLSVERDGTPLASVRMPRPWLASLERPPTLRLPNVVVADVVDLQQGVFKDSGLVVRIRSRSLDETFAQTTATRQWTGDFTIPLSECKVQRR